MKLGHTEEFPRLGMIGVKSGFKRNNENMSMVKADGKF
jgi:hypothetical protein